VTLFPKSLLPPPQVLWVRMAGWEATEDMKECRSSMVESRMIRAWRRRKLETGDGFTVAYLIRYMRLPVYLTPTGKNALGPARLERAGWFSKIFDTSQCLPERSPLRHRDTFQWDSRRLALISS